MTKKSAAKKPASKKTTKEPKTASKKTTKEPKAKKETTPKEPKAFVHAPRVLPFIGKDLTHTERDGTVHTCSVREDGFWVKGVRYNSATSAAKPLQPVDEEGNSRAVNGLVYWNIVKPPRPAVSAEAVLESATKAIGRAVDRAEAAIEAAGDKKTNVRRALQGAVKEFEKLLEAVAA